MGARRINSGCTGAHAPHLCVALDTGVACAVDDVGTLAGVHICQRLLGGIGHQVGVQDLQLCHGALFALKVALGIAVLYAVHLAVVVPDGLGALFEDVLFQQLLPGVAAIGAGEVEEASLAAPPAAIVRSLTVRGLDKDIVLFKQVDVGVVLQDAGLQVGDDIDAPGVHVLKELLRLREALVVPVEHIAQVVLFAAGIAGRQPEVVDDVHSVYALRRTL